MSGEKSFTVDYEEERLRQLRASLEAMLEARARANEQARRNRQAALQLEREREAATTRERLQKRREDVRKGRRERERKRADHAAHNEATQVARWREYETAMVAARSAYDDLADSLSTQDGEDEFAEFTKELERCESSPSADIGCVRELESQLRAAIESHQLSERVHETLVQLETLKESLDKDEAIQHFKPREASDWRKEVQILEGNLSRNILTNQSIEKCRALQQQAESIFQEAGAAKAKFEARNTLLRDIIDSMKEIGFFVADPRFERPDDPCAPVIVVARRGSEEMTASVDLSNAVQSTWDGITESGCRDGFFAFVERMKARHASVAPTRPDLLLATTTGNRKEVGKSLHERRST